MAGARFTRRRFIGLAASGAAALTAGPLVTGRLLPATRAATVSGKGVSPGKLMYLATWDADRYLDRIAAITPGGWVRTDLDWARIERTRGTFDWSAADYGIQGAVRRGLRPIVILGTAPAWANQNLGDNAPPTDPTTMAPFARAVAQRYGPLGVVFEVWNEPNFAMFWRTPDPAAYTALLRVVSTEIRAASPSSTIITGGTAPGGTIPPNDFLRGIYAAGGRSYFDGVGYHPYSSSTPPYTPGSGFLATPALHDVMAANGDGAKQVWGTEIGWRTGLFGVTESQQATYLTQAFTTWRAWSDAGWAGPLLWFNLRDESLSLFDPHTAFGLYRYNWSARPAYWALQNA